MSERTDLKRGVLLQEQAYLDGWKASAERFIKFADALESQGSLMSEGIRRAIAKRLREIAEDVL